MPRPGSPNRASCFWGQGGDRAGRRRATPRPLGRRPRAAGRRGTRRRGGARPAAGRRPGRCGRGPGRRWTRPSPRTRRGPPASRGPGRGAPPRPDHRGWPRPGPATTRRARAELDRDPVEQAQEHVAVDLVVAGRLHPDERAGPPGCRRTRGCKGGTSESVTRSRRRRSPGLAAPRTRSGRGAEQAEQQLVVAAAGPLEHLRPAVHHDDHAIVHARPPPSSRLPRRWPRRRVTRLRTGPDGERPDRLSPRRQPAGSPGRAPAWPGRSPSTTGRWLGSPGPGR